MKDLSGRYDHERRYVGKETSHRHGA